MRFILVFVVLLAATICGVLWAADGRGTVVLVWDGLKIEMSLGIALIGVSAVMAVLGVTWAMMFGIVRLLSR